MVYIKVPQNAPEAIYKSIKCKNFLEQHSQVQVPESAPETIQESLKSEGKAAIFPGAQECTRNNLQGSKMKIFS